MRDSKNGTGSITGRDGYILAQALAYAIEVIGSLPEDRQERSNREDMKKYFEAMFNETMREIVTHSARCHLNPDAARLRTKDLKEWAARLKQRRSEVGAAA